MDWAQLWEILSLPDNVPIVGIIFLFPFFLWYAFRQAFANDRLIDKLRIWRWPRKTVPYEILTLANIAFLIFVRIPADWDPIGQWIGL